jgi:CubicO group peptidase (beta-lactamase class C family)
VLTAATLLAGCSTLPGWVVLQGQSSVADHKHFDNAPIAHAAVPSPLPAAPATLKWPGGMDTAAVEAMAAANGTLALVVVRRGEVVFERYFNGHSRGSISGSMSVAKSFVSALMGIAIAEGRVASVDDAITRYLPELLESDPRFARITLKDLLSMRSGIAFTEVYGQPFTDAANFYLGNDLKALVKGLRIGGEPNQAYAYKSGDTELLSMTIERAVGQPLATYAQTRLWQPMGAEFDASWSLDSAKGGVVRAFCCLNASAVDFARFGLVFLNDGRWNGQQIVPAEWVRQSTAAQSGLPGADDAARRNIERPGTRNMAFYAWQWRRAPLPVTGTVASAEREPGPDFYAQGLYGQLIYIAPQTQTVVVRVGTRWGDVNWPNWLGALARSNP